MRVFFQTKAWNAPSVYSGRSRHYTKKLPTTFPTLGRGDWDTLDLLAPHLPGRAARMDRSNALAHMDPPTPWITWATALWNAPLNQIEWQVTPFFPLLLRKDDPLSPRGSPCSVQGCTLPVCPLIFLETGSFHYTSRFPPSN